MKKKRYVFPVKPKPHPPSTTPIFVPYMKTGETEDGQSFIAMAYYEGETLKAKIKDERLKIEDIISITMQVAQGLKKAHENKIIHRDIKPANIMITNDDRSKIVDFGLAKVSDHTLLTKSGTTMGTVAYMSPEQV